MSMPIHYNLAFVALSIFVAIFSSYVALEFAYVVTKAQGRARAIWLACGATAMGIGIWSMHFIGMLAFSMPGMAMAYDVPLMVLSILIAVGASGLALYIVSRPQVSHAAVAAGGTAMAIAIAGMHYTGMYSMRMAAQIEWNLGLVALSVLIALAASLTALLISIRIRHLESAGRLQALAAGVMGVAIAGMHYVGMAAATFVHSGADFPRDQDLLATDGLAVAIVAATLLILGLSLASSGVVRALHARSRRAEAAEHTVLTLEQERDLRDRFMSALAHDLRTPLTAAKMSAQIGARQTGQPEETRKQFTRVVDSLARMDGMIQDLLDAHRISAGRPLQLRLEPCPVNVLLESVVDDVSVLYGKRFRLHAPEAVEAVWDEKCIRRAVENLCSNAAKYGSADSEIGIDLARHRGDNSVSISVHNSGNPISASEQPHLFGLFQRSQTAEASGKKGWGLGLTIVKGLAEAHGGQVSVTSSAEAGTTFTLHLPADARQARV